MLIQRRDTPLLLAATRCAIVLAEVRGWSAATTTALFDGLKAVLDGHTGDNPVPLSQVRPRCGHRLRRETVLAVPQVRVAARWISCSRAANIEM